MIFETIDPAFAVLTASSIISGPPPAIITESTPFPLVASNICSSVGPSLYDIISVAPYSLATSIALGRVPTAKIFPAPCSFAPAIADNPTGPIPNTATVPPLGY